MYLVFAGNTYYPMGGWSDFIGTAKTVDAARLLALHEQHDWYEIVDLATLTAVETNEQVSAQGAVTD